MMTAVARIRPSSTLLRTLHARPARSPATTAATTTLQQRRGYAYNKNESVQSRDSKSNYSHSANDGYESIKKDATVQNPPPPHGREPPLTRPAYMIPIGAAVLGLGYYYFIIMGEPSKVVKKQDKADGSLGGAGASEAHPANRQAGATGTTWK